MFKKFGHIARAFKQGRSMPDKLPGRPRGVALILVLVSLAFMGAAVGELSYNQFILYRLAIYERDAAQAESLASGGLNLARLFLVMQDKLQKYLVGMAKTGAPLPSYAIWNLLPLDSQYLKLMASGQLGAILGAASTPPNSAPDPGENATFIPPPGGYGGFEGEISLKIEDTESKISLGTFASSNDQNVRNTIRKLLYAYLQPQEYDYLFRGRSEDGAVNDRHTLIANIFGYLHAQDKIIDPYADDANWGRYGAGSKTSLYRGNYGPKNEYLDSMEELRLVPGVTDEIMDVLQRGVTIYGSGGKINFYSAGNKVLEGAIRYCAADQFDSRLSEGNFVSDLMVAWDDYKNLRMGPIAPENFMKLIEAKGLPLDRARCSALLDVSSKNFTITATATVGSVTRKLTLVSRIADNAEELYYFTSN